MKKFLEKVPYLIFSFFLYNKEDFSYIFSFIIGIFYIISCLIILNFDILIYGLGYIFFSLCGQGTGFLIGKFRKRKKRAKQS